MNCLWFYRCGFDSITEWVENLVFWVRPYHPCLYCTSGKTSEFRNI